MRVLFIEPVCPTNCLQLAAGKGYSVDVKSRNGQSPRRIEVMDDDMAPILSAKTGAQRLRIASGMFASARNMLLSHLRAEHPGWDERRIQQEVARRLSRGAT
jgi:hypothetical protein